MEDPIEKLGNEKLYERAIDVMVQLEKGTAERPVLWLLVHARDRAAKAMLLFIDVDPTDSEAIRKLQNEIRIYDGLVEDTRDMLARGRQADHEISELDRATMQDLMLTMSEEDRQFYQLQQRGTD